MSTGQGGAAAVLFGIVGLASQRLCDMDLLASDRKVSTSCLLSDHCPG